MASILAFPSLPTVWCNTRWSKGGSKQDTGFVEYSSNKCSYSCGRNEVSRHLHYLLAKELVFQVCIKYVFRATRETEQSGVLTPNEFEEQKRFALRNIRELNN